MTDAPTASRVMLGMRRGLAGRCPHCGEAHLFAAYLKVVAACRACGHELARYKADDGPAYFTILIVGHLVVAPLLFGNFILTWPVAWLFGLIIPAIIILCLAVLPLVKGAFVGYQWAIDDTGGP